jgi:hypothetical protein
LTNNSRTHKPGHIIFQDSYTRVEFEVAEAFIPGHLMEHIKAYNLDSISIENTTPSGVFLYVRALENGGQLLRNKRGWKKLVETHPELARDSYMCALHAALAAARDVEDEDFERRVVDEMVAVVQYNLDIIGRDGEIVNE